MERSGVKRVAVSVSGLLFMEFKFEGECLQ